MALELTSYDLLPQSLPSFARGFAAAFIATVSCYPLDTIRRHIQLQVGGRGAADVRCAAGGAGLLLQGRAGLQPQQPRLARLVWVLFRCRLEPRRRPASCTRPASATRSPAPLHPPAAPPSPQAGRSVAFHVAARTILAEDGLAGMYRGFVPNALKNLPNKGARGCGCLGGERVRWRVCAVEG